MCARYREKPRLPWLGLHFTNSCCIFSQKATGVITFDEWLKFCEEHILAKTKTMEAHPMIDSGDAGQYKTFIKAALGKVAGPQHVELYWYMLEIFTDHDTDKDGIIKQAEFSEMMNQFLATPKKLGLTCPAVVS